MRPITRRSTLALPVEGWAWALTSVGTRRSIGRKNTNRFDFQDRVFAMDGPGGDAGVAQDLHDLDLGPALGELAQDAVHLVVVGPPLLRRVEALVADQVLAADGLQQLVPVPVAGAGGVDEAVVVEAAALA